jgi:ribosomal protein L37AE/L43A
MQKEKTPSKTLPNKNNESSLRKLKACPYCHSCQIEYRKLKGYYICRNCAEEFNEPTIKQVKDRRDELPIPPTLRRLAERHQKAVNSFGSNQIDQTLIHR